MRYLTIALAKGRLAKKAMELFEAIGISDVYKRQVTPMMKATPILSVMTDDLGVLHEGAGCGCGIASPYLELKGRAGIREIRTCAAGAEAYLRGQEWML